MDIRKPRLKQIAPLTNSNAVMFIWLNAVIGYSLIVQAPNPGLIFFGTYALSYIWAGVFFCLSAGLILGKLINNWKFIKFMLSVGLFTKLIITYSLLVLGFQNGFNSVVAITGMWVAIAWVQFFTVKYFDPPGEKYAKQ